MELIWNEADLVQPALITIPIKSAVKLDIKALRQLLKNGLGFYSGQQELEETAALCSRLIARRKRSISRFAGFKSLCKLNSALCRLLRLNIVGVLNNFLGLLPEFISKYGTNSLPYQSNCEYVLIRLIGLNQLFIRIDFCCKQVASYFTSLMAKFFFPDTCILYLAVISSVWKIGNKIREYTRELYKNLLKFKEDFPKAKKSWLKENLKFPEELETVKGRKRKLIIDSRINNCNVMKKDIKCVIKMIEDVEKQDHMRGKETQSITAPVIKENITVRGNIVNKIDTDLGTAISRETLQPVFDINNIKNAFDIRKFFKQEDKTRKESYKTSITKRIPWPQYIMIKKRVQSKIISNDNLEALKIFHSSLNGKI